MACDEVVGRGELGAQLREHRAQVQQAAAAAEKALPTPRPERDRPKSQVPAVSDETLEHAAAGKSDPFLQEVVAEVLARYDLRAGFDVAREERYDHEARRNSEGSHLNGVIENKHARAGRLWLRSNSSSPRPTRESVEASVVKDHRSTVLEVFEVACDEVVGHGELGAQLREHRAQVQRVVDAVAPSLPATESYGRPGRHVPAVSDETLERTEGAVPDGAADLVADLYRRMPDARITDILLEVDDATRFTEAFTHLRTGSPCRDRIGLLNVLLAEGINLGLRKMAEATTTHGFWELMRIARWHVEGEAYDRALSMVVEAQAALPMAAVWGTGRTASSDGQFFPAAGRGEALNLVNARYGTEPGVKAYSHVSDRFSPFATQTIPATVHEAPYILDGLLMNETGRRVHEQYADTGGFTDHVFAACSILGYTFVPRIRDLPSKRLYVFERAGVPKQLRPLVGGKVNADLIDRNWADILRVAATMAAGTMRPSQILRKLAAYPRQNELAGRPAGSRPRRTLAVHDRLDHGPRHAPSISTNVANCETEPRKDSTTGSPASTCWPRSSSTGTRGSSVRPSSPGRTPASTSRPNSWPTSRRSDGNTST